MHITKGLEVVGITMSMEEFHDLQVLVAATRYNGNRRSVDGIPDVVSLRLAGDLLTYSYQTVKQDILNAR